MAAAKNDRDEIITLLIEKDAKLDLVMKVYNYIIYYFKASRSEGHLRWK